jgi:hypothetical protein
MKCVSTGVGITICSDSGDILIPMTFYQGKHKYHHIARICSILSWWSSKTLYLLIYFRTHKISYDSKI